MVMGLILEEFKDEFVDKTIDNGVITSGAASAHPLGENLSIFRDLPEWAIVAIVVFVLLYLRYVVQALHRKWRKHCKAKTVQRQRVRRGATATAKSRRTHRGVPRENEI